MKRLLAFALVLLAASCGPVPSEDGRVEVARLAAYEMPPDRGGCNNDYDTRIGNWCYTPEDLLKCPKWDDEGNCIISVVDEGGQQPPCDEELGDCEETSAPPWSDQGYIDGLIDELQDFQPLHDATPQSPAGALIYFGNQLTNMASRYGPSILRVFNQQAFKAFNSFNQFKSAMGAAGVNAAGAKMHWHHVVEKSQEKLAKFSGQLLHNTANIVSLRGDLNTKLNGLYSSKNFQLTGSTEMRIRDWLATKSYEYQVQFGIEALEEIIENYK